MATKKFAPKLPLQLDNNSQFVKIDDFIENSKQKLRMIILTSPGEKIMEPNFGVGIRQYLFENQDNLIDFNYSNGRLDSIVTQDLKETIKKSIISQVTKYASDIEIYSIDIMTEEQILYLSLGYNYKGMITDTLEMQISI